MIVNVYLCGIFRCLPHIGAGVMQRNEREGYFNETHYSAAIRPVGRMAMGVCFFCPIARSSAAQPSPPVTIARADLVKQTI